MSGGLARRARPGRCRRTTAARLVFPALLAWFGVALLAAGCSGGAESPGAAATTGASPSAPGGATAAAGATATPVSGANTILARAYAERISDLQVEGEGIVVRILRDDDEGNRHQRFIVRLATGQTLLIAHNIDLAPRVADLREGDTVAFSGEYEWNEEGGTIHWTHLDPGGEHVSGWILHGGRLYQ